MRRPHRIALVLGCLAPFGLPAAADIPLRAKRVAAGLSTALGMAQPPNDNNRLFAIEKGGAIRIVDLTTNTVNPTNFLTISGLYTASESGLLGIAFDPNYATSGYFYTYVTIPGGQYGVSIDQVRRYTRSASNPNIADPASMQVVMQWDDPQGNHNGGWMSFGQHDPYLYISVGDGGNFNDTGTGHTATIGNAQDLTKKLGKMLRIDVRSDDFPTDATKNYAIPRGGPGQPPKNPFAPVAGSTDNPPGDDEIWDFGLRNPWRNSFDRKTGDLWIGDVGQDAWEEIDFEPSASTGGVNYGWRFREGFHQGPGNPADIPPGSIFTDPIHEYANPASAARAITGGHVYRGSENPALEGTYFFADSSDGQIWSLRYDPVTKTVSKYRELTGTIAPDAGSVGALLSFGEDNQGRLYMLDGGEIFRIVPAVPGDANLDRIVNSTDFMTLYGNFGTATGKTWLNGDFNDDGLVNFLDFQILELSFGKSVPFGALPDGTLVPEPAGAIGLFGSILMLRRRRGRMGA
jgi:glucose/arabinose dehydrogenase